jgi:hypothetical protein
LVHLLTGGQDISSDVSFALERRTLGIMIPAQAIKDEQKSQLRLKLSSLKKAPDR